MPEKKDTMILKYFPYCAKPRNPYLIHAELTVKYNLQYDHLDEKNEELFYPVRYLSPPSRENLRNGELRHEMRLVISTPIISACQIARLLPPADVQRKNKLRGNVRSPYKRIRPTSQGGMLYQALQSSTDSHFNVPDPVAPPRSVSVSRVVATAPVGPPLRIRAPPSAATPSSPASSSSPVWQRSCLPPAHASSSPYSRPVPCSSRSASPACPSRRA